MQCPFVYANGHRCTGTTFRARAYGPGVETGEVERSLVFATAFDSNAPDDSIELLEEIRRNGIAI